MNLMMIFFASFVFIFLKAFQQRNVAFDHYNAIIPTSIIMAFAEVFVIYNIVIEGFELRLILAIGLGSGFGALIAAKVHKQIMGEKTWKRKL